MNCGRPTVTHGTRPVFQDDLGGTFRGGTAEAFLMGDGFHQANCAGECHHFSEG